MWLIEINMGPSIVKCTWNRVQPFRRLRFKRGTNKIRTIIISQFARNLSETTTPNREAQEATCPPSFQATGHNGCWLLPCAMGATALRRDR